MVLRSSRAKRWLGRAGLLASSVSLALIAGELVLRVAGIAPERFAMPRSLESADKRTVLDLYPDDPHDYFPIDLRDPRERRRWREHGLGEVDARWERTPHGVPFAFTEELCRGTSIPLAEPGVRRVVAIGDSFTEGQGVREADTFAARLDARLGARVQVVNCGRRGYDFPELHELFTRHLALEPDVVLYAMLLNDPVQSEAFHARQRYVDDWILDRRRMVTEGDGAPDPWTPRVLSVIADRLEGMRIGAATTRWYREMVEAPNAAGWKATLDHLSAMDRAMRERGGALVVVLWPLLVELDGDYPFEATHRTIRAALERRSIRFHDTLDAFRGIDPRELWVHPSDRHPNARAHAIFADEVEGVVRAALAADGGRS